MPESYFLIKLDLRPGILLKRDWHRCFPVNFAKFVRTPFLQNTSGQLLLLLVIDVIIVIIDNFIDDLSSINDFHIKNLEALYILDGLCIYFLIATFWKLRYIRLFVYLYTFICDDLRDLVPFVQFKKRELLAVQLY